VKVIRWFS